MDSLTCVPAALDSGDLLLGEPMAEPAEQGIERPLAGCGGSERIRRANTESGEVPAPWGNPADPLVYVSYGSVCAPA